MVTEGNWLWWLTTSGCTGAVSTFTMVESGTSAPDAERT